MTICKWIFENPLPIKHKPLNIKYIDCDFLTREMSVLTLRTADGIQLLQKMVLLKKMILLQMKWNLVEKIANNSLECYVS